MVTLVLKKSSFKRYQIHAGKRRDHHTDEEGISLLQGIHH